MDICQICFLDVQPATKMEHDRFHKRYGHHAPFCQMIMYPDSGLTCSCPMQYIYI